MDQHVKTVAILNIVLGVLGILVAFVIAVFLGGIGAMISAAEGGSDDAVAGGLVMGGIGMIVAAVFVVLSIPGLVGGWGLLQFRPWARILVIVISALNLMSFPIGTAIGVYGLWALLHRDSEPLFGINASPERPAIG